MAIRTLLLTGANNHDWKRSSPFFKKLLEDTGLFEVTLAENASAALEDRTGLERYSLLFSDYNGPPWSPLAATHFEAAVRGGAGLVILHAADNAFAGWVEYEKMVGLLWREGTGHGWYHQFKVQIVDREHPITGDLDDFEITDELYHRLVHMHQVPCRVLTTAWSDPAKGGTGNHEPAMVVTQYGRGRVFHMILGHVWTDGPMTTLDNLSFQRCLVRGCQWAATGNVTPVK
jgi:type 1 glutamine amidotransferase